MTPKKSFKIVAEPGKLELFIYREFEAAPEVVYKAFSDPALLIQWLGPENMVMKIDKFDFRSGGSYRYTHTDGNGNAYSFRGVVHEVAGPERVIQTFEFEEHPERGQVSLDTSIFEKLPNNRTRLTIHSVYRSVANRDAMIMSMEAGFNEGLARLDALLAKGFN